MISTKLIKKSEAPRLTGVDKKEENTRSNLAKNRQTNGKLKRISNTRERKDEK